jgi:hypothetical protein
MPMPCTHEIRLHLFCDCPAMMWQFAAGNHVQADSGSPNSPSGFEVRCKLEQRGRIAIAAMSWMPMGSLMELGLTLTVHSVTMANSLLLSLAEPRVI